MSASIFESGVSLIAVPDARTVQRLQAILGGSPVHIDWQNVCLLITTGEEDEMPDWTTDPDARYEVTFIDFGFKHNDELGHMELTSHVKCPAALARAIELGEDPAEAANKLTVVFNTNATPAHTNRVFVNSILDTLVHKEDAPFVFTSEQLLR